MKNVSDYYQDDGKPIKCIYCDSTSLFDVTTGTIEGIVTEFSVQCAVCEREVGYWAHGYYEPVPQDGYI